MMNMFSQTKHIILFSIVIIYTTIVDFPTSSVHGAETKTQEIPKTAQVQLDSHIKHYIDQYEKENCEMPPGSECKGTEYKKARRFCVGDIDGDGKNDIAVLYTIESLCCGNNYHFYLAAFINKGPKFELVTSTEVGCKGNRGVEFNTIKNGKILLNTNEYLPDDPMCCPSGKGRTTYLLENRKLVEHDRIGEKPIAPIERFRRASERTKPLVNEILKKEPSRNEHELL
jgi:hypothetical protein